MAAMVALSANEKPGRKNRGVSMKAVQYRTHGTPEVLECMDIPTPRPGAGEVLVKTESISVNFADTHIRKGIYPVMPPMPIPGLEASGFVAATGRGVVDLPVGQPVMVFGHHCYAEYVNVCADNVVSLPESLDMDQAAALQVNYLTAYHMLHHVAHVSPDAIVLVTAAAGGVGSAVAQLAKLVGATVIGLTSSDEKAQFAKSQGVRHTINYKTENVVERVSQLTAERGADIILDSVQGSGFGDNFDMLAPFGRLVFFGAAAGPSKINLMEHMRESAFKSPGVHLFNYSRFFRNRIQDNNHFRL